MAPEFSSAFVRRALLMQICNMTDLCWCLTLSRAFLQGNRCGFLSHPFVVFPVIYTFLLVATVSNFRRVWTLTYLETFPWQQLLVQEWFMHDLTWFSQNQESMHWRKFSGSGGANKTSGGPCVVKTWMEQMNKVERLPRKGKANRPWCWWALYAERRRQLSQDEGFLSQPQEHPSVHTFM